MNFAFLKDVFLCSLMAFGGPEAHYAVFFRELSERKKYVTHEEITELMGFTSILPGPSSTQTITAIGYRLGGVPNALLTFLVWALPAILLMTFMGIVGEALLPPSLFTFLPSLGLAYMLFAALTMGKKVIKDGKSAMIFIAATILPLLLETPWIFPLVLIGGGVVSSVSSGTSLDFSPPKKRGSLLLIGLFFVLLAFTLGFVPSPSKKIPSLFFLFYRYGSLVIGGGNVVIPMMIRDLGEQLQWLSVDEFLSGYGLVQGFPGPMFSFSAYAGALATDDLPLISRIFAAFFSSLGIFLPGLLLLFFTLPGFEELRTRPEVKVLIKGISAAAGGTVLSAGIHLLFTQVHSPVQGILPPAIFLLLWKTKIPGPVLVAATLALGFILGS